MEQFHKAINNITTPSKTESMAMWQQCDSVYSQTYGAYLDEYIRSGLQREWQNGQEAGKWTGIDLFRHVHDSDPEVSSNEVQILRYLTQNFYLSIYTLLE